MKTDGGRPKTRRRSGAGSGVGSRRRGTILIVVLILIIVLSGMTLVLCRAARVEALASANHLSGARAAAVERAAEQYALAQIVQGADVVLTQDESYFAAVPVGNAGYFWFVRPAFDDPSLPVYGLVDEASKLNLNSATSDMMQALGMTSQLANSIVDWRDADSDVTDADGAEEQYYAGRPSPYTAKNEAFETVEELLLVQGASPQVLYGRNYGQSSVGGGGGGGGGGTLGNAILGDTIAQYGLIDYITVYSKDATPAAGGGGGGGGGAGGGNGQTQITGKINVNTAPREVLLCLPGLDDGDATAMIQARTGQTGIEWVQATLGDKAAGVAPYITGESKQFSADIIAASADGRAYRRVRIVIDASDEANPPKIVYRRDITADGWPLDPTILQSLRAGQVPSSGGLGSVLGSGTGR
jgi:type II secretory pathway component PulK